MSQNIRLVSIGDLVVDYYYFNSEIVGIFGGMSCHNIIANLADYGFRTGVFGVCGNDELGNIAKKSLEVQNIDTSHVLMLNDVRTRAVHVNCINDGINLNVISELECPNCHEIQWYQNSQLNVDYVLNNIKNNDILIFDSLDKKNQMIIKKTNNIKLIDIGHISDFYDMTINDLIDNFNKKFEIINVNGKVYEYILKKYNLHTYEDFTKLFGAKLTIITNGKEGANFIYKNKLYQFKLRKVAKEVDPTGAGDAFFSSIIADFINNQLEFDELKFNNWFENATLRTSEVVKNVGARSHICDLFKIEYDNLCCVCKKHKLIRKKRKI